MARVSQEHLDARRRQIMDGAALCFARGGFHATSMQDVLKEVGLSAGAVYRYFSGKEELIRAIVTEVLDDVRTVYEEAGRQAPPPPPYELIDKVLRDVHGLRPGLREAGVPVFARLMIQVWTETLRDPELAAVIQDGFSKVTAAWVRIVEGYQRAGMMSADADPEAVARVMVAAAQGFLTQQALFDRVPVESLQAGLRGLMSMGEVS
ncbi:TetR/AcrR family transcriptional regulator [Streptomyces sp. cg28]|uniref:TetR/AcrR family transcriptional regulator n=1 Tax=unclassified Streptomyces TaxID=2593676 RepID=UPI000DBA9190|nr:MULTISPECIES: TetR/AcrR family transcriptional regulator [unclassified Streptomyces]MYT75613.1 TetR family transcriptional regulator [Streptomyces sp. SID8367]RAJ87020.1 TetR family transcriptional regulator [Streptomyces sp. PsTaAH-137]